MSKDKNVFWLGQFLLRWPPLPHLQHKCSLLWHSIETILVDLVWSCPTFSTSCCNIFLRIVRVISVELRTSFSSSICWTLVLPPCSFPGFIYKNSFPALTASSRVYVEKANMCLCSGKCLKVLQKRSNLIPSWCSVGSAVIFQQVS